METRFAESTATGSLNQAGVDEVYSFCQPKKGDQPGYRTIFDKLLESWGIKDNPEAAPFQSSTLRSILNKRRVRLRLIESLFHAFGRPLEDRFIEGRENALIDVPNNLPLRGVSSDGFFGRAELLQEIGEKLKSERPAIALSGMAGAGKTELAIQFAYESMQNFSSGICWISAYGEESTGEKEIFNLIADEITTFARSILNIKIPDDQKLPVEQLRYCLRSWEQDSEENILIIVDDIQIYEYLRGFLGELSRFTKFRLLVTSRYTETGKLHLERIDVDVLNIADAFKLLKYLVEDERIADSATDLETQLCEYVGNLPLGLECLGRYLHLNKEVTVPDLLEELNRMAEDSVLVEHEGFIFRTETRIGATAQRGLIAAFDLTWNILSENDRILGKLIGIGFRETEFLFWKLVEWFKQEFADSDSSLSSLHELRNDQLRGSRRTLIAYSLLKEVDDTGERYRIHPLVLEYFRYKEKQEVIVDE